MRKEFIAQLLNYVIGLSDEIIHMIMKIAVNPQYEDERKTLSLRQVTFHIVAKMIICFK